MVTTQHISFKHAIQLDRNEFNGIEDFFASRYRLQPNKSFHILQQAEESEITDEIRVMSNISLSKDKKYFTNI